MTFDNGSPESAVKNEWTVMKSENGVLSPKSAPMLREGGMNQPSVKMDRSPLFLLETHRGYLYITHMLLWGSILTLITKNSPSSQKTTEH